MAYAYLQNVPIDEAIYGKIADRLGEAPIEGLILHLVSRRPGGGLQYLDVWDDEAACERAFTERIHPAVYSVFQEIGFRPDGEPERDVLDIIELRGDRVASGTNR
ncbi:MAG: hypothetical protein NVSMB31_12360 [Vulcanimicrobiaceae bacterium]